MIQFKPLEFSDLERIKYWRNDSIDYTREYRLLNQEDQRAWFDKYIVQRRNSDWDQDIMMIHKVNDSNETEKSYPVAVGGFTRIEWKNQKAELTCCFRNHASKKELILEILQALLDKGFNAYNFNKITWPIYGHDTNLKTYQELFETEAVLKQEYFYKGIFQDRYYLSIIK